MKIEEKEIPALIRQGKDKEVIHFLYKNVLPNVKKYIKNNSGSGDDALDIFQDALLAFYQSVMDGSFNMQYKAYGYVYRLCVYRWINKVQRNKLRYVEELPEMEVETPKSWFSESENKEEASVLTELFSDIGDKCLELLNYMIYKGMLVEDIMIRMNFPSEAAVRMQHQRCKEKVMKEVEKNPTLLIKLRGV